jgi:hypothetical protein
MVFVFIDQVYNLFRLVLEALLSEVLSFIGGGGNKRNETSFNGFWSLRRVGFDVGV